MTSKRGSLFLGAWATPGPHKTRCIISSLWNLGHIWLIQEIPEPTVVSVHEVWDRSGPRSTFQRHSWATSSKNSWDVLQCASVKYLDKKGMINVFFTEPFVESQDKFILCVYFSAQKNNKTKQNKKLLMALLLLLEQEWVESDLTPKSWFMTFLHQSWTPA